MTGSEFQPQNILNGASSAAFNSKPAETDHSWRPPAEGLYDLSLEKDSCGVGFIANIKGMQKVAIPEQGKGITREASSSASTSRRIRPRQILSESQKGRD